MIPFRNHGWGRVIVGLALFLVWASSVSSFVVLPEQRHIIAHRRRSIRTRLEGSSSTQSSEWSSENINTSFQSLPSSLRQSFQKVSFDAIDDEVPHHQDDATILKTLVKEGAHFDSYRRRFDFGGVWVRNSTLSMNVDPYLRAHGLNATRALYEASRPYAQRFERIDNTSDENMRQAGPTFHIDTDFGRRVQVYAISSEWTESAPNGAVLFGGSMGHTNSSSATPPRQLRRQTAWQSGSKHVTVTFSPDGCMDETTRYLDFRADENDWVLVVERRYVPIDADAVECREIFERVYGKGATFDELFKSSRRGILTSPLDRVRGCVANVKVRTILVPEDCSGSAEQSQTYRVWLDGEADAMTGRGLLALLSRTLAGGVPFDLSIRQPPTAEHILQIDPERVADYLGLRGTLTRGRNDGLASMMRVVQDQVRSLLEIKPNRPQLSQAERQVHDTEDEQRPTVAMLLSGGVDSSVALNLLVRQNYNVTAFYLKIWLEDELAHLGQCPWEDDFRMCQAVCEQAGVPLETISLQEEYKDRVIFYTVHEAERGRTPNPDIMCNSRVKFGCFYEAIEGRGFDHVASGHYAQLIKDHGTGLTRLLRAPDPVKDQSYFLCALTQDQLQRVLFPIGHYEKSHVRELAEEFDLPNKKRPDSQGLCFLGKVKFDEFLAAYLGERPGKILDAKTGEIIGRHKGVWYHTVGQRKGIGKVLDPLATSRGPWYVVAKNPQKDIVFASNEYDEETFTAARSDVFVEDIQWVAGRTPTELVGEKGDYTDHRFRMKIRHGPKIVEGSLRLLSEEIGNVKLDNKDGGLAPGQYVVFYSIDDPECLGSGVISEKHWARFLLNRETAESTTT